MWTRAPLASDLPPLCAGMRAADAAEIYALRDHADSFRLAGELWRTLPFALIALVAGVDGEPSATAFAAVWPKDASGTLGEAALFATEKFPRLARPFVRHVRKILLPALLARGVRRVECRSAASYRASHRLLEACGARRECLLTDYAPAMDFVLFAWTRTQLSREARGRAFANPKGNSTCD